MLFSASQLQSCIKQKETWLVAALSARRLIVRACDETNGDNNASRVNNAPRQRKIIPNNPETSSRILKPSYLCSQKSVCEQEGGRERERDLECDGRSRCCSIQGGKAKLTVSQTLCVSLFGPYLPPSTFTLPPSPPSPSLSLCT